MVAKTDTQFEGKLENYTSGNGAETDVDPAPPSADPFAYGYRVVAESQPDGTLAYHYVPLTQHDFLDPQVGDHIVQSDRHFMLVVSLYRRFKKRYRPDTTSDVFSDLKMLWGIPGVQNPAPDVAVVHDLQNKGADRASFDIVAEGTRPCLVVEVSSPNYPFDDNIKVEIYERAGIAEYIIVNPFHLDHQPALTLTGYRLVKGQYRPMPFDAHGRLLSQTTNVYFALDEAAATVILTDALTGVRLLTDDEEEDARVEAEARAATAEAELAQLKLLLGRNGHAG